MKTRTQVGRFLLLTMLLIICILQPAHCEERKGAFYLDFADIKVTNMPLAIRDVPIHSDDSWGKPGPISKISYPIKTIASFDAPIITCRTKKMKLALRGQWFLFPHHSLYDNALRNYTNAPGTETRGYGAALTFCGVETRGIIPTIGQAGFFDLFVNVSPEILASFPVSEDFSINTSISYFKIQAVTGWDRYDNLEVKDTYNLANCYPIGISANYKGLAVGLKFLNMQRTELGNQAGIETSGRTWSVSYHYDM